ncbi:50S ribosomal protein L22 [Akkermansiaceae bacterium]|nr:50S ribosomal protein L22 [Akkermansiaceae bacterium]
MQVRSTTKYARISPKKARDVAREIQGLPVSDALDALTYTPRKAAQLIGKTLKSAIANAENNHELSADELIIQEATIGDGPTLKRFKPRARGSAGAIRKRSSHIFITLTDEFEAPEEKKTSGKPKKRDTMKSLFGAKAAAAVEEEVPAAAEEKSESAADHDLGKVYDEAPAEIDDLKEISGVGPALEAKLHGFGIYTYAQVAAWSEANITAFDDLLSFKGRIERDNWLQQAADLDAAKGAAE